MSKSSIELIVEPRVSKSLEKFVKESPPFSIALDGYVIRPPAYDHSGPHLNLNHHEGVDRLATRSTTGQVMMAIKQGLFDRFRRDGDPAAVIYVNDPDQDTAKAVWLLKNHERVAPNHSEPLVNRLIFATDALDTTSGMYPFDPNSDLMKDLAWIDEPYTRSRPRMKQLGADEMRSIIEAMGARITQYAIGKGEQRELDTRFETLHRGAGYTMVREILASMRILELRALESLPLSPIVASILKAGITIH